MPNWLDRVFTPRPIPRKPKAGQKPPRATKVEGAPRPYSGTLDYEAKVQIPERPEVREALARVELPGAVLVEGEHPRVEGVSRGDASTGARRIESLSKRALASEKREHEREAKKAEREARKAAKAPSASVKRLNEARLRIRAEIAKFDPSNAMLAGDHSPAQLDIELERLKAAKKPITTHAVYAASTPTKGIEHSLTHACTTSGGVLTALCGKVKSSSLMEDTHATDPNVPPTCPRCLALDIRARSREALTRSLDVTAEHERRSSAPSAASVEKYRDHTEHLFRLARNDFGEYKDLEGRERWSKIAKRMVDEYSGEVCPRAKERDTKRRADALTHVKKLLAAVERERADVDADEREKRLSLRATISLKDPTNALLSGNPSLDELRAEVKRLSTETTQAQRDAERRAYHAALAGSHAGSADAAFKRAHGALAGIEPGQPILVGHHSEGKHRRAIERSDNAMRESIEAANAAKHHAHLARHSHGAGIRIGDDDAVFALRAKLLEAEEKLAKIVAAREKLKKEGKKVDAFWATNASANVRRIKQRIAEAEKFALDKRTREEAAKHPAELRAREDVAADQAQRDARDANTMSIPRDVEEISGVGVDYSDGRILLTFNGKPREEVRTTLKSNGWKWSPSRGAWSRLDTPNARAVLRRIASKIEEPVAPAAPITSITPPAPPAPITSIEPPAPITSIEPPAPPAPIEPPAPPAQTKPEATPLAIALFVFQGFAVGTREVAQHFGIERDDAYRRLARLEQQGIVAAVSPNERDSKSRRGHVGSDLTWQSAGGSTDDTSDEEFLAFAKKKLEASSGAKPVKVEREPDDIRKREIDEMAAQLVAGGYPHDAARRSAEQLSREGMGPFELEQRIKTGQHSDEFSSITAQKRAAAAEAGDHFQPLYGHDSQLNAYVVSDYPYGFNLRTSVRYWLEHRFGFGWRLISQTQDPKTQRWNAPKPSGYAKVAGAMYLDEKGHVQWDGLNEYSKPSDALRFVKRFPKADLQALRPWVAANLKDQQKLAAGIISWNISVNGVRQPKSEEEVARERAHAAAQVEAWSEVARAVGLPVPTPPAPKVEVPMNETPKVQERAPRAEYTPPPLAPKGAHTWGEIEEERQVSLLGDKTYNLDLKMPEGWEDEAEAKGIDLRDWLDDYVSDAVRSLRSHGTKLELDDLRFDVMGKPAFIRASAPSRAVLTEAKPLLDFIIEGASPGGDWEYDEWDEHQRGEPVEYDAWVVPIIDPDVTLAQLEQGALSVSSRKSWLAFAPVVREQQGAAVRRAEQPLALLGRFYFEDRSGKPTGSAIEDEIPRVKEFVGDVLCEAARVALDQYNDDVEQENHTRSLDSAAERVFNELFYYANSNAPGELPSSLNRQSHKYELSDTNKEWCRNVAHWAVRKVRGQIARKHNENTTQINTRLEGQKEARRLRALAHAPLRAWWKRVYVAPGLTPLHPNDDVLRQFLTTFHNTPEHAQVRELFDRADVAEHGVGGTTHAEERAQWHAWLLATMREISAESHPTEHRRAVENAVAGWTMDVIRKAPDAPITNEQCYALEKEIINDPARMEVVRAGLLAAGVPENEITDLVDTYIFRTAREHNEPLAKRLAEKKQRDDEQRRREESRERSERAALEREREAKANEGAYAKLQEDAKAKELAEISAVSDSGGGLDAKDEKIGTVMVVSPNGRVPRPFFFQAGPFVVNRAYVFSKRSPINSFNVTDMESGYSVASLIVSKEAAKEVARVAAQHIPEMVMSLSSVKGAPESIAFTRVPPVPADPEDAVEMKKIGVAFGQGMKQLGETLQKPIRKGTHPIGSFNQALEALRPEVERLSQRYVVSIGAPPTPTMVAATQHAKDVRKAKAALPTFAQARATLFSELEAKGWSVTRQRQGTSLPMKIPYATSPRGLRFDFHPQAIYTNGHSITSDYRDPSTLAMLLAKGGTKQDPYSLHTPETLTPEAAAQGEKATATIAAETSTAANEHVAEASKKAAEHVARAFRNYMNGKGRPASAFDREEILETFTGTSLTDLQKLLRESGMPLHPALTSVHTPAEYLQNKAMTQKWIREQLVPLSEAYNQVRAELSAYDAGVLKILNEHPTFNANALKEVVQNDPHNRALYASLEAARDLGWRSGANLHVYPSRMLDDIIKVHVATRPKVSPPAASPRERSESQKAMSDIETLRLEEALKDSPNANARLRADAEAHLGKMRAGEEAHDFPGYAKRLVASQAAFEKAREITASDPHPGDFMLAMREGKKLKWPYLAKSGPFVVYRTITPDLLPGTSYGVGDTETGQQVLGTFTSRKKAIDSAVWMNRHLPAMIIRLGGEEAFWHRLPMVGKNNFLVGGQVLDSAQSIRGATAQAMRALLDAGDVSAADKLLAPYHLDLARAAKSMTTVTPTH